MVRWQQMWNQCDYEEQFLKEHNWNEEITSLYGWESSQNYPVSNRHHYELAMELGPTSLPHKSRCYKKNS